MSFNTSSPTLLEPDGEYVPNALDGGDDGWLTPHSAIEVHVHDPGTGIKEYRLYGSGGWGADHPFYGLGECEGIQCPQTVNQVYHYSEALPNGEDSLELFAEDAAGLYAAFAGTN